ncbi:MAG: hypothetical protein ACRDQ0_11735 [Pseudonocardia sp.]
MTDEQLPPYTGDDIRCAKCGNTDASTEYRAKGRCHHDGGPIAYIGLSPNERLHRECACCGHQWDEAIVPPAADIAQEGERLDRD